tara:strand:- start:4 stop:801 length:798 start_codon:yes stop_codon:yes gene_type:complete
MKQTFSVVTTWGLPHWDTHAKRSVQSIIDQWPQQVEKLFYPDDITQQIVAPNTNYYSLLNEQPEFATFKTRAGSDAEVKEKMNVSKNAYEYDVVRFAHKVFSVLDAAEKCTTDQLIWLDADTVTYKPITMEWLNHIAPEHSFTTFIGRPKKGYSECGFVSYNISSPYAKEFFTRWRSYYSNDLYKSLNAYTDCHTYDAVRIKMKEEQKIQDNDLNDGRFLGYRGSKHPFVNSELGDYMDHLKGERKDIQSSVKDMKVKRQDEHWQ